jgi:hypothetical protein
VLLVAFALAVASPALRAEPRDSFPLSSYPMFSHDRGRIASIATAVGLDAEGGVHRLGPRAVGGGDEVMLAVSAASRAARNGPAEAARFCAEVAGRVDDSEVVVVEVRTEVRDAVDDVGADREPLDVVVHARCEVRP